MIEDKSHIPDISEKMVLAQSGDKQAYRDLLHTVSSELNPFLIKKIANESDREDVLQNILIAIHNARHSYTPGRPFKPWMYAIANHKVIDYYRQNKRKSDHEIGDLETDFLYSDETISELETNELLEQLLKKLPARQALIVKLMKLDGLSVKETAAMMEMTVSAVKVSAHRAYKIIQKEFKNED